MTNKLDALSKNKGFLATVWKNKETVFVVEGDALPRKDHQRMSTDQADSLSMRRKKGSNDSKHSCLQKQDQKSRQETPRGS